MSEYKEMHEPAQLEFCMVLDGLEVADQGVRVEHLAPLGNKYYFFAHSHFKTIERIITVQQAIKTAMIAAK